MPTRSVDINHAVPFAEFLAPATLRAKAPAKTVRTVSAWHTAYLYIVPDPLVIKSLRAEIIRPSHARPLTFRTSRSSSRASRDVTTDYLRVDIPSGEFSEMRQALEVVA
jgi:hypothetical protein